MAYMNYKEATGVRARGLFSCVVMATGSNRGARAFCVGGTP